LISHDFTPLKIELRGKADGTRTAQEEQAAMELVINVCKAGLDAFRWLLAAVAACSIWTAAA